MTRVETIFSSSKCFETKNTTANIGLAKNWRTKLTSTFILLRFQRKEQNLAGKRSISI